jgi:hypothetical protein
MSKRKGQSREKVSVSAYTPDNRLEGMRKLMNFSLKVNLLYKPGT